MVKLERTAWPGFSGGQQTASPLMPSPVRLHRAKMHLQMLRRCTSLPPCWGYFSKGTRFFPTFEKIPCQAVNLCAVSAHVLHVVYSRGTRLSVSTVKRAREIQLLLINFQVATEKWATSFDDSMPSPHVVTKFGHALQAPSPFETLDQLSQYYKFRTHVNQWKVLNIHKSVSQGCTL